MTLIYHNESKKGFAKNADPTEHFMRHYVNFLVLKRIANSTKNFDEKYQAQKEMLIAERKMKFWEAREGYNHKLCLEMCRVAKSSMK